MATKTSKKLNIYSASFIEKHHVNIFAKIFLIFCKNYYTGKDYNPSWKMEGRRNVAETMCGVKCAAMFKGVIRDLMGESALIVLERQLSRKLTEAEPFEYMLIDPRRFYDALASIIGPNAARTLLKLIFKQIAEKHKLTWLRADELIAMMIKGGEGAKEQISKLFQEICKSENY